MFYECGNISRHYATFYNDYCAVSQSAADDDAVSAATNDDQASEAANDDQVTAVAYETAYEIGDQRSRQTVSYVTCSQCQTYGCTGSNDDAAAADDVNEAVVQLIDELSTCLNTGVQWNGNNLYVGFMCSPYDGNGVKIAGNIVEYANVYI